MSLEAAMNSLRKRWNEEVAIKYGWPTEYANELKSSLESETQKRARLLVRLISSEQVSLGQSKRFRYIGEVFANLFVAVGLGEAELWRGFDQINESFRSVSLPEGPVLLTPEANLIGRDRFWFQMNISCPFYHDEIN